MLTWGRRDAVEPLGEARVALRIGGEGHVAGEVLVEEGLDAEDVGVGHPPGRGSGRRS
jgi:hypothetical protein